LRKQYNYENSSIILKIVISDKLGAKQRQMNDKQRYYQ